jgi:type I restriction-modification system DNA methylase subunit
MNQSKGEPAARPNSASIVSKVWNFCHTLRDDGVSYGEYLEQLTYLLFLKMADEYAKPPYNRKSNIPKAYNWESLSAKKGAELEEHYVKLLRELGQKSGMLGQIFFKAQNRIQDPAKLFKIIDMIDRENWVMMDADVKGEIYEGLLEKNAEDVKSGAGQYFTPRPLIRAMVECPRPEPKKTIADPACGTGGFFLAAYDFLTATHAVAVDGAGAHRRAPLRLDKQEKEFLKFKTFRGWEIVPDNVLFEGGAGETIRKKLLASTDLHTILRLSTGIFYAQGVKANVIYFGNRPGGKEVATKEVWYYDYRTNIHHTKKKNPLQFEDLLDFVKCYNPGNRHERKQTWSEKNPEGRWRKFTCDEIIARDKTSMDIFWLKDESLADLDNLPDPDVLAGQIVETLEAGLEGFREIVAKLG